MDTHETNRGISEPVTLPDVATGPHGVHPLTGDTPPMGEGLLGEVLPAVMEAARKGRWLPQALAEIARQLEDQDAEEEARPAQRMALPYIRIAPESACDNTPLPENGNAILKGCLSPSVVQPSAAFAAARRASYTCGGSCPSCTPVFLP